MHNPSVGFTLYLLYDMIVHLRVGVRWKLVALGVFPLQEYHVYPCDGLER
jgi:hypothetical protein